MFFQNSSFLLPNDWAEQLDECCPELKKKRAHRKFKTWPKVQPGGMSRPLVVKPLDKQQLENIEWLLSSGYCEDVTHWIGLGTHFAVESDNRLYTDYNGPDLCGISKDHIYGVTSLHHDIEDEEHNARWAAAVLEMPGVEAVILAEAPDGLNVIIHRLPPATGLQVASMVLDWAQQQVREAESHAARATLFAKRNEEACRMYTRFNGHGSIPAQPQQIDNVRDGVIKMQQAARDAQQAVVTALQQLPVAVAAVNVATAADCCCSTARQHAPQLDDPDGDPWQWHRSAAKDLRSTALKSCTWSPEPMPQLPDDHPDSCQTSDGARAAFNEVIDAGHSVARTARGSASHAKAAMDAALCVLDNAKEMCSTANYSSNDFFCLHPILKQPGTTGPFLLWDATPERIAQLSAALTTGDLAAAERRRREEQPEKPQQPLGSARDVSAECTKHKQDQDAKRRSSWLPGWMWF